MVWSTLFQQLQIGLANGAIIALIALGYTMVYGVVELINFAHGELFMLGAFAGLSILAMVGPEFVAGHPYLAVALLLVAVPVFCGLTNVLIDKVAFRPLRAAPRLVVLVSAIGVSYVLLNIGLFWGGLPLDVFGGGHAAAAPKDFPSLISPANLLGESSIVVNGRDVLVFSVTLPMLIALSVLVNQTKFGRAMRAVAQDPLAAELQGIDTKRVIRGTFFLGGALGGVASVIYALFNGTIYYQMGYRVGMDAFTAAVLGGIGNLTGACLGGVLIGLVRACSDQYIATSWTNAIVFSVLIIVLIFRPAGLLGKVSREKV
jgi:branched-chain amino acid transport system permease protein